MGDVTVVTERLTLRHPVIADAAAVGDLLTDPEVMRFIGGEVVPPEHHAAVVQRWLDRWEEYGVGPFIVERDGRFLGRTGILVWDVRTWSHRGPKPPPEFLQPEVGWAFVRAAWGNGYATEAARAVIEWARTARSLQKLVSVIAPANVASQRVAERLGATPGETVQIDHGPAVVWHHPD